MPGSQLPKNMFWIFKRHKPNLKRLGLIPDPRPPEEKERDYVAEEVFAFPKVDWREKSPDEWRKYPIFNQDGSSSCAAQTIAKVLGIENVLEEGKFVFYSARDIYTRRKNFPSEGMYYQNAMEIGYKYGATLEQLMPSQGLSESEMNRSDDRKSIDEQIALVGKGGNYFRVAVDIDKIAAINQPEGKAVAIGVKFGPGEWNSKVPQIKGSYTPYYHAVTVTDFLLWKGKKAVLIEDSWGPDTGFEGRRIVTEDWFKAKRITSAWAYKKLENTWRDKEKPSGFHHKFERNLSYGMWNKEVEYLQEALRYLGFFPTNAITSGYYGAITASAVLAFQKKHKVASKKELEKLGGKVFGPKTREKLNELLAE